jgi:hypothetical protein
VGAEVSWARLHVIVDIIPSYILESSQGRYSMVLQDVSNGVFQHDDVTYVVCHKVKSNSLMKNQINDEVFSSHW